MSTPSSHDGTPAAGGLLFPRWLRLWHWTNAGLFAGLIATGFSLHFASLNVGALFRWSVYVHNVFGIAVLGAYLFYVAAMVRTGHIKQYWPRPHPIDRLVRQARYYLGGIFRDEHHPFVATVQDRFNPLQQAAYAFAMFVLFPVQAVTGIVLLFPGTFEKMAGEVGILMPNAVAHTLAAYGYVAFLIVHLYLAITASEAHTGVRAMVHGDAKPETR